MNMLYEYDALASLTHLTKIKVLTEVLDICTYVWVKNHKFINQSIEKIF